MKYAKRAWFVYGMYNYSHLERDHKIALERVEACQERLALAREQLKETCEEIANAGRRVAAQEEDKSLTEEGIDSALEQFDDWSNIRLVLNLPPTGAPTVARDLGKDEYPDKGEYVFYIDATYKKGRKLGYTLCWRNRKITLLSVSTTKYMKDRQRLIDKAIQHADNLAFFDEDKEKIT